MNFGFNYVFVFVCKVNLLAELLYVVVVKKYSSKVGGNTGTQLQKRSRSGTQKAKGWESLLKQKLSSKPAQKFRKS